MKQTKKTYSIMKKTFKTLVFVIVGLLALASCEDVPAPYNLPDKSSESGGSTIAITCSQAVELAKALADGATSSETYTITGYITEVVGNVSRNQQTFWMADTKNGGKVFEAYWANLPEGVTAFTAGTKVKITGKLMKFVNNSGSVIPEMKNAVVTILEDDGGGTTPVEEGTQVTCAQAVQLTNDLPDSGTSTETYTVTGYITQILGAVSTKTGTPQQSFWMSDDKGGENQFQAYYANLPTGVSEFTVGMKVKITGKLKKYMKNDAATPEMQNPDVVILEDGGGENPPVSGTDITCSEAVQLTNALPDSGTSAETYTITGYITQILGAVSTKTGTPQQSFWMSDDKGGENQFQAYYANLPTGVSEFTVGMKVKITGKLKKYMKNDAATPEMQNPDVVILEDGGSVTPTPTPGGDAEHITIAEFLQKADANTVYELTGTVRNISNTTYGNFDLVEGDASIYIYGLLNLNGEKQKFASIGIEEGDIVTLTGKYKLFNNKPEIVDAQLVSFTKGEGGDTPQPPTPGPGGDPVSELVNGDFESWDNASQPTGWKPASTAGNATLSQSTDARNGSFACKVASGGTGNKRLATQELTLSAGSYTFSFYAKTATAEFAQTKGGHVPVTNGSVGAYKYTKNFTDLNNTEWTYVSYDFELTEETTLCLLIMNPKDNTNPVYTAQDILIDDATLVKK